MKSFKQHMLEQAELKKAKLPPHTVTLHKKDKNIVVVMADDMSKVWYVHLSHGTDKAGKRWATSVESVLAINNPDELLANDQRGCRRLWLGGSGTLKPLPAALIDVALAHVNKAD